VRSLVAADPLLVRIAQLPGGERAFTTRCFYPLQDLGYQGIIEFLVYLEEMVHAIDYVVLRSSGVDTIDGFGDGVAVCPAHDGVSSSIDDQQKGIHALPNLLEIE
jgi:hypothetical protein